MVVEETIEWHGSGWNVSRRTECLHCGYTKRELLMGVASASTKYTRVHAETIPLPSWLLEDGDVN